MNTENVQESKLVEGTFLYAKVSLELGKQFLSELYPNMNHAIEIEEQGEYLHLFVKHPISEAHHTFMTLFLQGFLTAKQVKYYTAEEYITLIQKR